MIDDDNNEIQSLITLNRVLFGGRRKIRLSQKELAVELSDRTHQIDYITYSKIENARIDIRSSEWDWLILKLSYQLQIDKLWLQAIREQTAVKRISPNSPTLITYARQLGG